MSSSPSHVHIDVPELLTSRRRVADTLATGLMWILYSYLWAPLISLLAWLLVPSLLLFAVSLLYKPMLADRHFMLVLPAMILG